MSGAVPPLAARPLERAARVPRPVCPGCGRCRRGDQAPVSQRAPLWAGVARCGSGRRASPGGVLSTVVRGARCQALSLPWPPVLWSGQPGFRVPCVPAAVGAGVGTRHRPHSVRPCGPALPAVGVAEERPQGVRLPPLRGASGVRRCPSPGHPSSGAGRQGSASRVSWVRSLRAWGPSTGPTARAPLHAGVARRGGGGGRPRGGVLSTVVRGARCQALSLPWSPVLWSGQPRFRVPCVPGAVGAGVGTQHRPHNVRPCGPALLAVGVAEGRPRGGCFPPLRGAPGVRRRPSPGHPSSGAGSQGSAFRVSRVRSVLVWGSSTGPAACALAGRRCSPRGWRRGVPGGGGAFHRCEGRMVPGAVPPLAARPLERAARVPRPACPGCGRCGRGDSAAAPQRAPLRAGVARCECGGRASPGGCLPPM